MRAETPSNARVFALCIAFLGLAVFPRSSLAAAGGTPNHLSASRQASGSGTSTNTMSMSALRGAGGRVVRSTLAWAAPLAPTQVRVPLGLRSVSPRAHVAKGSLGMLRPLSIAGKKSIFGAKMTAAADSGVESEVSETAGKYPHSEIEPKWQKIWQERKTFRTEPDCDKTKPKFYALDMFPYPSGAGLHVGHPEGYTATDILCRYKRMTGHNVMHPMGWDAFGLPAEQYAIQTGTHPALTTEKNINRFREQLQSLGFSYDWERELSTTDEKYYKWTQWIFLQLFEKGLAYQAEVPVNWCPALGTVLANEEVIDGKSERGDHPVFRKNLKQWMLKITAYADRLLEDIDEVDWPESVKEMQRNWIGKSEGAEIDFEIVDGGAGPKKPIGDVEGGGPEEEIESGKVYVGGIPWLMDNDGLKAEMERFGKVKASSVVFDKETGKARGFGFAEFVNAEDATKALGQHDVGGRTATIRHAKRSARYRAPGSPASSAPPSASASAASPKLKVFTTRPDTLFGATYMVVSPEHPLLDQLVSPENKAAVDAYVTSASTKSDLERTELQKDKSGLFTGSYATNPLTGKPIPVWVADYVLATYGTGAIMAVPAHDTRDYEFAVKFDLPVVEVVDGRGDAELPYTGDGPLINSSVDGLDLNGMGVTEAKAKCISFLEEKGVGQLKTNYKLRDWLFSRQRYWGEPFPIVFGSDDKPVPVPYDQLPVTLPEVESYQPSGTTEGPLSTVQDWVQTTLPDGSGPARRETNTMPQWAGSCWYYLRFLDPDNVGAPIDPEVEKYWMPVDLYLGGAEHAVLHLLYARFWHKVLYDVGVVHTKEPFQKLVNQGLILGPTEHTAFSNPETGDKISAKDVKEDGGSFVMKKGGAQVEAATVSDSELVKKGEGFVLASNPEIRVLSRAVKMSKSRGNVVNPDDVVSKVGADSLRLYLMFMGPLEQVKPWSISGVDGVYRFLNRVWRLIVDNAVPMTDDEPTKEQMSVLHATIKRVTDDTERLSFNTAIAAMMEFTNAAYKWKSMPKSVALEFIQLLNPYAPHMAEELWERMGNTESVCSSEWPKFDEKYLVKESVTVAVQVNGKVRATIDVPADVGQDQVLALVEANEAVQKWTDGKTVVKRIYVPGKICNLVVK